MTMKVLLRESIRKLGMRGEIVEVAPGYARNYLLPRNLALPANRENMRRLDAEKRQYDLKMAQFKEARMEMANKLRGVKLDLSVNATAGGNLYGAIHDKQIVDVFTQQGFQLDTDNVMLPEPIRTVGTHRVPLKLHPDLGEIEIIVEISPLSS